MIAIIGFIVVMGAVIGGFVWAGGHIGALIHPSEFLTIGGAAIGSLIIMSPAKVLKDMVRGILQSIKGSPYNKQAYEDMFRLMYDLLRTARREGLIALEAHITSPHESRIFEKYPRITNNHHVLEFICGTLQPVIEGSVKPEQLPGMIEKEIKLIEENHHAPVTVLTKTADALPGFGIVAAVMGVVITMGAIDGPVEEIGHKVGAALVGTFLGILLSYGFVAPLAMRMDFLGLSELQFFRTIGSIIQGFVNDFNAKITIEQARRGLTPDVRPTRERLDELFAEVDAS